MRIRDLMERAVLTVGPELPLRDLADFLSSEEITGAPVVDDRQALVGVVSQSDLVRALQSTSPDALADLFAPEMTVADVMTREVLQVDEREDAKLVASKMLAAHVHRAIVVRDGEVTGIVTTLDLLRAFL
jgi:CBS domain-containing protein